MDEKMEQWLYHFPLVLVQDFFPDMLINERPSMVNNLIFDLANDFWSFLWVNRRPVRRLCRHITLLHQGLQLHAGLLCTSVVHPVQGYYGVKL